MPVDIRRDFMQHPILGSMDAFYVPGGLPYLRTRKLRLGALPFESTLTLWTDPEHPSDMVIKEAVDLVNATDAFRTEVENRFFEDYMEFTRDEYLKYADDPAYEVSADMLPAIALPAEIWSIFKPLDHSASIHEPTDMCPDDGTEVVLSFRVDFDEEHEFHMTFLDGTFYELTR